jgi:hypothetical protein
VLRPESGLLPAGPDVVHDEVLLKEPRERGGIPQDLATPLSEGSIKAMGHMKATRVPAWGKPSVKRSQEELVRERHQVGMDLGDALLR